VIQDGRFRYANPALAGIFGYRREDLEGGLGPADLTHPDDRDKVAEFIRRRIAGEVERVHYTFRALHRSGRELHCEVLGQLVSLEGKPAVAGTLLDITEREQAQQGLLESEALFRGVAEKSPNAIFINQRGKVVYTNSSAVELLGFSQAELTGPGFDFFKLIAPESKEAIRTHERQHQKGQEVSPYECRRHGAQGGRARAAPAAGPGAAASPAGGGGGAGRTVAHRPAGAAGAAGPDL
jgi:PAS domain S-box-containing protein